ncbi:unnamed protein product, partial [Mesorhabditis spiculigera]
MEGATGLGDRRLLRRLPSIFVLGLIGNTAVIYLTFKHRHLQTVQNMFILNLALSDVIVCLLSMPFTLVTNIYKAWYFGSPFCHLLPMVQGVSIFVSTFSLSAIALDRYNLVARVLWRAMSLIVSVIVCLPYGWYMRIQTYPGFCGELLSESWPSQDVRLGYALLVLTTQFLLPFATMAVCYYTIFSVLKERAAVKLKKLSERSQLLENSTALAHEQSVDTGDYVPAAEGQQRLTVVMQQRRTTMILASMVLLFGGTWLPYNLFTMLVDYGEGFFYYGETNYEYFVSTITHSFAMITIVANPFLYAWLNPSFKEILMKTLRGRSHADLKYHTSISRTPTVAKKPVTKVSSKASCPSVGYSEVYQNSTPATPGSP